VIRRPEFDITVLGLITANAVMMAMNDPLADDPPWLKVVELVNFCQRSPFAYLALLTILPSGIHPRLHRGNDLEDNRPGLPD
jgi:hypothetical protein